jgi:hypothetical protein
MNKKRFDMEECIKERKERRRSFIAKETKLTPTMRIVGVPELSRFRTRVVLNECLEGKPIEKAVERALSITDKRH